MGEISRAALFGKLDPIACEAMEGATVFCAMQGDPHGERAHRPARLVQATGADLDAILRHFLVDASVLARMPIEYLGRLARGDALRAIEPATADGGFTCRFD